MERESSVVREDTDKNKVKMHRTDITAIPLERRPIKRKAHLFSLLTVVAASASEPPLRNERTLSSAQIFFMKLVFPAVWISMFGLATIGLFLRAFHDPNNAMATGWMKWQFLAIWIAGSALIWWSCVRLKRVRTD